MQSNLSKEGPIRKMSAQILASVCTKHEIGRKLEKFFSKVISPRANRMILDISITQSNGLKQSICVTMNTVLWHHSKV